MEDEMKYSNEQMTSIIEREGLDYAIMDYITGECIEDEELAQLWDSAREALEAICKKLEPYGLEY